MRWRGRRRSEHVEDRRRQGPGRAVVGGGIGVIIVALIAMALGADPTALLQGLGGGSGGGASRPIELTAEEKELGEFVSVVLADTEDVWHRLFAERGLEYREPTLVLYRQGTRSGCGYANAAVGPFYCPADQTIYVDLSFFDALRRRFDAPGDFAQAYVIAHEVAHHVQHLLGLSEPLDRARGRVGQSEQNRLSVRLELQADFLAGVWAHHAERMKGILETGDLEEALRAASAIGDDTLQRQGQGHVVPDSFTHGSSEQRVRWFRHGLETGDLAAGDTFDEDLFRRVESR